MDVLNAPTTISRRRRIMATLTVAQGLYLCAMSVDLTVTSLAGYAIASTPALATVPIAMIAVGSVAVAWLVPRLMARWSVRRVFAFGAVASLTGGVLSAIGVSERLFFLLCLGTLLVGVYQGVAGYYRYYASDISPQEERAAGMATVLSGGVVAAVAGPYLATWAARLLPTLYSGSYIFVAVLAVGALVVISFLDLAPPTGVTTNGTDACIERLPQRRLSVIFSQPSFIAGATGAFVGYFVMAIVMAGAPIAVQLSGHVSARSISAALVVQMHMVGMYAPMLLLPLIMRRYSVWLILILGTVVLVLGAITGLSGTSLWQFTVGLLLAGIGWSLMYSSGSILLSNSYVAAERSRARGYGEIAPVGGMMLGSLLSATLITSIGWTWVNVLCLALLLLTLAIVVFFRSKFANGHGSLYKYIQ
jgi:MFS family permease